MPYQSERPRLVCWGDSLTVGLAPALASFGFAVEGQGVGGQDSTQIAARMVAKAAWHGLPTLIWAGANNFAAFAMVLADVAAMVNALDPGTPYLVLAIPNGENPNNYRGQPGYAQILGLNAALAATYGDRYFDLRAWLVAQANPSVPQDVIDLGHDIVPSSLRVDPIHLSAAGYALAAGAVSSALGVVAPRIVNSPVVVVNDRVGVGMDAPIARFQVDGDGGYGALVVSNSGKTLTRIILGVSGGPSQIVNGDVLGDGVLMVNGRLLFSTTNGQTIALSVEADSSLRLSKWVDLLAVADPPAPIAGRARLYCRTVDGKSQFCARFFGGDPVVIAAEV